MQAALVNPQMTEARIVRAVKAEYGTELLAPVVCRHPKWSHRNDVKAALLGNKFAPQARLQQFAMELPLSMVKDALRNAHLTPGGKRMLQEALEKRQG